MFQGFHPEKHGHLRNLPLFIGVIIHSHKLKVDENFELTAALREGALLLKG
jgi:hypothetical protein